MDRCCSLADGFHEAWQPCFGPDARHPCRGERRRNVIAAQYGHHPELSLSAFLSSLTARRLRQGKIPVGRPLPPYRAADLIIANKQDLALDGERSV